MLRYYNITIRNYCFTFILEYYLLYTNILILDKILYLYIVVGDEDVDISKFASNRRHCTDKRVAVRKQKKQGSGIMDGFLIHAIIVIIYSRKM